MDLESAPMHFPLSITPTDLRPDMVIWSSSAKKVIIIELTVPAEENVSDAHQRKVTKYQSLISTCILSGWDTTFFAVEVGCKGFIGHSFRNCLKQIGISSRLVGQICRLVSKVVLRCSYLLYLSRGNRSWNPIDLHVEIDNPGVEGVLDFNNSVFASDLS